MGLFDKYAFTLERIDPIKYTGVVQRVQGGLIVHLGCGDGELTAALHAGDRYIVHGLDSDADHVAQARARLAALELAVHDQKKGPVTEQLEIIYSTSDLCLSRDGTKLAYCRYADGRTTGLMVRDLVTGDEIEIAPNGTAPVFSPNGSELAYTYWAKETPRTRVHVYSLDTGEDR